MIVVILIGVRAALWGIGVTGMSTTPLISSVISGGIFVMGLVLAGTLVDYRDAERAPTDVAASLYALLRETEAMNRIWGKPDMATARARLIAVVTALRADITSGNTRECQAAIENLSPTLEELEETKVPANYIVRLRSEQAALRKAALRVYHIQREEFLPSAKAMITSVVAIIMLILLFTDMGGLLESVVTIGFLGFFFIYLLRLLNVIDKPFKAGRERTDDDVSLFLATEFVVYAQAEGTDALPPQDLEAKVDQLEEQLTEVEEAHAQGEVDDAAAALEKVARNATPTPVS
ncbi:MAG: hypothetical protein U1E43_02270 [Rhodospirillales bacterium]